MARVPDAACIEHVGLRLFLCPGGPVPDASRLLRHPAREQGDLPRCSDAASSSGLGRAANRGMRRLGSSATAIFDSRSRQPLWRELRSSRAGSWNTASSYVVQVAPTQCRRRERGEICAIRMFGPSHCFQRSQFASSSIRVRRLLQSLAPAPLVGPGSSMRRGKALPSASMPKDRRGTCAWRVTPHLPRCCVTSFCAPQVAIRALRPGRPKIASDTRDLIRQMSTANPLGARLGSTASCSSSESR
jgi:hypothetical protein